ncbi:unnamed protein product, partial [Nesidiocoris tenuis]
MFFSCPLTRHCLGRLSPFFSDEGLFGRIPIRKQWASRFYLEIRARVTTKFLRITKRSLSHGIGKNQNRFPSKSNPRPGRLSWARVAALILVGRNDPEVWQGFTQMGTTRRVIREMNRRDCRMRRRFCYMKIRIFFLICLTEEAYRPDSGPVCQFEFRFHREFNFEIDYEFEFLFHCEFDFEFDYEFEILFQCEFDFELDCEFECRFH